MLISLFTMLVLKGTPPLSVDEAFEILGNPRQVTEAQLVEAKETIDRACPEGDEAWIRRLMGTGDDIWEGKKGAPGGVFLQLACKKADDKTLPIILDALRCKVGRLEKEGQDVYGLALFSFADLELLDERLKNPEPLFQFALEMEGSVGRYPGLSPLKDKYMLEYISRQIDEGKKGGSYAMFLSDAAIAPLRELLRIMYQANPRSDGAWIGIETLTELSDTEIIPDLEAILASPPVDWKHWRNEEGKVRKYLAKLKHQHSPEELMKILETERDWPQVLDWAAWRLLWLGTDKESVYQALQKNRRPATRSLKEGMDIAERATYFLFGRGPDFVIHPKHGKVPRLPYTPDNPNIDPFIFDHDEFRQYHRDLEANAEKSRELREEEEAIRQAARLAPGFDYEEQRKDPGKWQREHPDEARRLVEIAEAKKALWRDTVGKYTLGAILERAPAGRDEARSN